MNQQTQKAQKVIRETERRTECKRAINSFLTASPASPIERGGIAAPECAENDIAEHAENSFTKRIFRNIKQIFSNKIIPRILQKLKKLANTRFSFVFVIAHNSY